MMVELGYTPGGLLQAAEGLGVGWAVDCWYVRRALSNGVPPDARDDTGETALMWAAAMGNREIVKLLLLHGADPSLRNRFGQTALDIAQASGRADVAALLRNAGPAVGATADPPRRFDARRVLLAVALVGGLLMASGLRLVNPGGTLIPADTFLRLLEVGQVAQVSQTWDGDKAVWVEGEVKAPDDPEVRRLGPSGRAFCTRIPDRAVLTAALTKSGRDVKVQTTVGREPPLRAPRVWEVLPMVAVPLAVAALLGRLFRVPAQLL
jgi:hypothetical protein